MYGYCLPEVPLAIYYDWSVIARIESLFVLICAGVYLFDYNGGSVNTGYVDRWYDCKIRGPKSFTSLQKDDVLVLTNFVDHLNEPCQLLESNNVWCRIYTSKNKRDVNKSETCKYIIWRKEFHLAKSEFWIKL